MKAIIPFSLKLIPIKKLALISFEKNPDEKYIGLELQYIEGKPYGIGWRVIAYRHDNYVDVYDDIALNTIENEKFDVVGNGLANHVKTEIKGTRFEKDKNGVHISFFFKDIFSRNIIVQIHENTKKQSKAMNLLAPIGVSSKKPTSFPLFFLYEFDFIRKNKTNILVEIDGNRRKLDNFPFPLTKELQWRYYTRYSMDCLMVELAESNDKQLEFDDLQEDYSFTDKDTTYYFNVEGEGVSLKSIIVKYENRKMEMIFDRPLPIERTKDGDANGEFSIMADHTMGTVEGIYKWRQQNGICTINLSPNKGWKSVPNSIITKIILNSNSVFCTWPKSYEYIQEFHKESLHSKSKWIKKL